MNKLLETIKIDNGKVCHLSYHQQRCDYSLRQCGKNTIYNLQNIIKPPQNKIFRCRIIYDDTTVDISYHTYLQTPVSSLKLIFSDIEYPLKFADRYELDQLYKQRGAADDVLIVKNNFLTDTTRANIALFDGDKWFTPKSPLLFGTTRQRLLKEGKIFPRNIHVNDLHKFTKIAVMNALVGFHVVKNGIMMH